MGEREDLAGLRVQDDDHAVVGVVGGDGLGEFIVGDPLQARVEGRDDVGPVLGLSPAARGAGQEAAVPVYLGDDVAVVPAQQGLLAVFQARDAHAVAVREAERLGGQGAVGVGAARVADDVDAGQTRLLDGGRQRLL